LTGGAEGAKIRLVCQVYRIMGGKLSASLCGFCVLGVAGEEVTAQGSSPGVRGAEKEPDVVETRALSGEAEWGGVWGRAC
jgi:hypothetical protein